MPDSTNMEVKGNQVIVAVNPKVYPLEAVYSAAYVFLDRAYIVLDGDPSDKVLVKIKLKSEGSLEEIGNEFNNELLNYADYLTRARETRKIREIFLQRAIITNDPSIIPEKKNQEGDPDEFDRIDDAELEEDSWDDSEAIAIPWEEKYCSEPETKAEEKNEDKAKQ